jgi:hypothetical protein
VKRKIAALAATAFLISSAMASAQSVTITSDQETKIRTFVTAQNTAKVQIPSDVKIEVGAKLPETVELHALAAPDVKLEYRYIMVDNKIVLVDPNTRAIVHIIES